MNLTNTNENQSVTCNPASEGSTAVARQGERLTYSRPHYRVQELDTEYRVSVDLPGVSKSAVEVSVVDGVLEIDAARSWENREDWNPLAGVAEDGVSYRLRLALGDQVKGAEISADLKDGVLQLSLAKAEEKKPRRIAVN